MFSFLSRTPKPDWSANKAKVLRVRMSPTGDTIATLSKCEIAISDFKSGKLLWSYSPKHDYERTFSCCFTPDGRRVICCITDTTVGWYSHPNLLIVFDSLSGKQVAEVQPFHSNTLQIQDVFVYLEAGETRVGLYVATPRDPSQSLHVLNMECQRLGSMLLDRSYIDRQMRDKAVSMDGKHLAWDGYIYDIQTVYRPRSETSLYDDRALGDLLTNSRTILCVERNASANLRTLAICFSEPEGRGLYVWRSIFLSPRKSESTWAYDQLLLVDLSALPNTPSRTIFKFPRYRRSAAFSSPRQIVASTAENPRKLELWKVDHSARPIRTLDNGVDIEEVSFSENGETVMVRDAATVKVWSLDALLS